MWCNYLTLSNNGSGQQKLSEPSLASVSVYYQGPFGKALNIYPAEYVAAYHGAIFSIH